MGMDLNWVAVCDEKEPLIELRSYIKGLFDKEDDDSGHQMLGYGMELYDVYGTYLLCGCWRKCFGYDLGYWLKQDDKEELVDTMLFFEERQDDDLIYLYVPDDDESSEYGVMSNTTVVGSCSSNVPEDDKLQSYSDIWPVLSKYLRQGIVEEYKELVD